MIAVVLRGAKVGAPVGGHAISGSGFGANQAAAPAVTLAKTDGSSALLHFFGIGDVTNSNFTAAVGGAPAGYTVQTVGTYSANNRAVALMTKNVTTSDGAVAIGGGGPWFLNATVEILAADVNSAAFFAMF